MEHWDAQPLGDDFERAPRLAIVVRHDGLARDLDRSLTTMGCRVERSHRIEDVLGKPGLDAILLDLDRPGLDLDRVRAAAAVPVIALSSAARAEVSGITLTKPFSISELERALRLSLAAVGDAARVSTLDPILETREPEVVRILERARRSADGVLSLVIEGELGVGRRALARATHRASDRGAAPLVVLNATDLASAAPEAAHATISEATRAAAEGTLLVVEPAQWSGAAQDALDRALRGDANPRLITIATRSLDEEAATGRLRRSLADRLDVVRLALPPLRSRGADHRALCDAVARRVARALGRETPRLDEATVAAWTAEGFPGNLLGLESRIRAALLSGSPPAGRTGAVLDVRRHDQEAETLDLKSLERDTIVRALAFWQGNRTRASESLGISVRTLRNKIRDYGLR